MDRNQSRIHLLEEMVKIKSYSRQEENICRYLVSHMEDNGFQAFSDSAGNAIGIKGDPNAQKEVILLGHMDTVPGDVPFSRDSDLLYGRGSVDAKGPLAAFISAVSELEVPRGWRFVIAGAVEEEISTSKGARFVAEEYAPDICIIGEPSGSDGVTVGYKGRLLIKAELEIACSHTASAETSAAERGVQFWNNILAYKDEFNRNKKGLFATLMTDLREFNTTTDGLHDSVILSGGFRLPPGFPLREFQQAARQFDSAFNVEFWGNEVAWAGDPRSPLVRDFTKAIRSTGKRPKIKYKTGTSDMNVVGPQWKCPILAYGPGDSSLDHTPNEHISISEYLESIDVLKKSLLSITNRG